MNVVSGQTGVVAGHAFQFTAAMVAPLCDSGRDGPGSFVSKQFDLAKVPSSAVLHISALGLYRAFINGHRVGDDLLTPGWTCYDDRIAFQSYDVAQYLLQGQNHIEIWLGNGWYRSQLMWATDPIVDCWGSRIAAIAELVTDGLPTLKTDQSWKSGSRPPSRTASIMARITTTASPFSPITVSGRSPSTRICWCRMKPVL